MTEKLPSKVRLAQIASFSKSMALPPSHDEIEAMARAILAAHEQEPVAWKYEERIYVRGLPGDGYIWREKVEDTEPEHDEKWVRLVTPLYTNPAPVPAVYLSPDIEYMAEDAECLAMNLDKHNVPKEKDGQELSLWGRVVEFCSQQAPAPAVPGEMCRWIDDVVEYLNGGLEADGELEAEGSIEAKRLLARHAAMLNGGKS